MGLFDVFKSYKKGQRQNSHNSKDKYRAIGYSKGEMDNKNIMMADLKNDDNVIMKFAIPLDSQIANRIEYFVINGDKGYLEDGLIQDKLIDLKDFRLVFMNINGINENINVHKDL